MTYQEAYRQGEEMLRQAGIEDCDTDALLLLLHVSGMDRTHYLLERGSCMPDNVSDAYRAALGKRAARIPLQHITGDAYFRGLRLRVSDQVLVPRQDTEVLAEEALRLLGALPRQGLGRRVLDLCTGSGCIIISLKHELPDISAAGTDLSSAALCIARENARRCGCSVSFYEGDLFAAVPAEEPFDLIVSNPPYIPAGEIIKLQEEVRCHDPRIALDGGADGLDFYRRIAAQAPAHLRCGGALALEIGADQREAVTALLEENGFTQIRCRQDLAGLDRVVSGRMGIHRGSKEALI